MHDDIRDVPAHGVSGAGRASRPLVVDLFAGAGLFSHAFVEEGFEVVQAVENDPFAVESYRANLGDVVDAVDVVDATPAERCDVLIAGPPCQGFSTLGKRDPGDARNRLSLELLRWVDATCPRVVLVENVAAFVGSWACRTLVEQLRQRGYEVRAEVLDARDFGVPQRRKRAFVTGVRRSRPPVARAVDAGYANPKQAWHGLSARPNGRNLHVAPRPGSLALCRMRVLPYGGDKRDIIRLAPELAAPSWIRCRAAATDVWGRMRWDVPANTLRTCFQNASTGRYIHPEQHRVITVREGARLQTIPDSWTFAGPRTRIVRQIGNAVPPLLGRALAREIRLLFQHQTGRRHHLRAA